MTDIFILVGANEYKASDFQIPPDRLFREAWAVDDQNSAIVVDMDLARDIWRDKIRAARIEPLAQLDAAFMKALETGADTSLIASQKQELRDAPADPAIDAATTPEELKAVQPAGLTVK